MNLSTTAGFLLSSAVFFASCFLSINNPSVLIDPQSLLVVVGGTMAVSFICFPLNEITGLLKVFFKRIFAGNRKNYSSLVGEIATLSKAKKIGKKDFDQAIINTKDPFLKEGAEILYWAESNVSKEELRELLETRVQTTFNEYMGSADIFRTIAKFPPAFGLLGTTLGMIALLQSLGGNQSIDNIGPAMAVALITTFYGVAFSNFVFIPIAENLTKQTKEELTGRKMVVESLMLINEDKPTKYVEEMSLSFLLPKNRNLIRAQGKI